MNAFRVRDIPIVLSYPLASFGHVQTSNGRHQIKITVDERYSCVGVRFVRFSCSLSCSHAFGILWVSCMYPLMSVRSTTGQVKSFPGRLRHAHSVVVQRTCCPLLINTVHIRSVRVTCTSITRTLVGRSLSVTCLVRMRSLRLLRRQVPPLRRPPSPDKHFMQIFCPFGVR